MNDIVFALICVVSGFALGAMCTSGAYKKRYEKQAGENYWKGVRDGAARSWTHIDEISGL